MLPIDGANDPCVRGGFGGGGAGSMTKYSTSWSKARRCWRYWRRRRVKLEWAMDQ